MCWEDIRIGRNTLDGSSVKSVANGSSSQVVTQDPYRKTLIISNPSATVVTVAPQGVTPTAGIGIPLSLSLPPLMLDIETHGNIVCRGWNAFGVGGTATLLIVEAFLPPDKDQMVIGR